MSFRRTLRGLSNQYLFFNVDAVVYVEGGKNLFSLNKILAGFHNLSSIDVLFWQTIFRDFIPSKKFKFLASGSKTTLLGIGKEILAGNITNVYIAMDRDHDETNKCLLKGKGIFYTFGYSWENDAWSKEVIQSIFCVTCRVSQEAIDVKTDIDCCFQDFCRDIRWAVYTDILLSGFGRSFFPRAEGEFNKLIPLDTSGKPTVNRTNILILLPHVKHQSGLGKLYSKHRIHFDPVIDCYGHLYRSFCFRLLNHLLKKHSTPPLPTIHADALAINEFARLMQAGELIHLKKHYQQQFAIL